MLRRTSTDDTREAVAVSMRSDMGLTPFGWALKNDGYINDILNSPR